MNSITNVAFSTIRRIFNERLDLASSLPFRKLFDVG